MTTDMAEYREQARRVRDQAEEIARLLNQLEASTTDQAFGAINVPGATILRDPLGWTLVPHI